MVELPPCQGGDSGFNPRSQRQVPSASGQAVALSRLRLGFDSPWDYQVPLDKRLSPVAVTHLSRVRLPHGTPQGVGQFGSLLALEA